MRHLLPFLWTCVFETQSPYIETPDNSWWDFFVCLKVETHPPGLHQRNNSPGGGHAASFGGTTVGSACRGPLWVQHAVEWSSHVALLNGDWTIRTQGQRAAHHRDSGIAQPSLGAPPPWVSGGVAPDQRTARLLRGGGPGWGSGSCRRRLGGGAMRVRPRRQGLGIWGQVTGGITENRLVFLWLEPAWYQADTFRRLNVRVISESRSNN